MLICDDHGNPIRVCGYASVFDRFSVPIARLDGRREIVRPGAFDRVVAVPSLTLSCVSHHLPGPGLACGWWRNLRIWVDGFGLCFEADRIQSTPANRWVISSIVSNELRTCSIQATIEDSQIEKINGEEVHVIRKFSGLDHLGPVPEAAQPDTLCWCSQEDFSTFSPYAQQVVAYWHANRPAEKPRAAVPGAPSQSPARVAANRPVHGKTSRRRDLSSNSRDTQRQPLSDEDIYGPAPAGMSMAAWKWFGHMEACGRQQLHWRELAQQRRRTS